MNALNKSIVTCGNCNAQWDESIDPAPSALCHICNGRGHSIAPVSHTTFAETKRGHRIWIEGANLKRANFHRGDKYARNVTTEDGQTVVYFTRLAEGKLKVAGRDRRGESMPIIDFTTTQQLFESGEPLTVVFAFNSIKVFAGG